MSEQRSVSISEPPSEGEAAKVSSKRNYLQLLKRKLRSVTSLVRVNSFRQQKLPAWRPMLTIASVLATFILAAIALIVIGAGFLYVITSTQVFQLDYTQCMPLYGSRSCEQILTDWRARSNGSWPPPECTCWYKFTLKDHFRANVYVYYALSNYYQNHLHYVRSKDMEQFTGVSSADKDCEPFRTAPVVNSKGKVTHRPIVPCGTIANSLFNDTFTLWLIPANWSLVQVPLRRTGIAWKSDYSRFKNPSKAK
ncbi:Cell cycle control protein 50A [Tyrophagus putrescentiae]|nr:Cell cycle control protein 50A [Tyrophagus putrescentiae]